MRARELRISSVNPSEKYSCSLSPLMFTNGSTAMECGGGLKPAAGEGFALVLEAVFGVEGVACECCGRQSLSAMRYVSPIASSALMTHSTIFDARVGCGDGMEARAMVDPDGIAMRCERSTASFHSRRK